MKEHQVRSAAGMLLGMAAGAAVGAAVEKAIAQGVVTEDLVDASMPGQTARSTTEVGDFVAAHV